MILVIILSAVHGVKPSFRAFRDPDPDIDPHQVRSIQICSIQICLTALKTDDLRNVAGNKPVQSTSVLPEAQGLDTLINLGFDIIDLLRYEARAHIIALRSGIFLFSCRNSFAAPAEIRRSAIHFYHIRV